MEALLERIKNTKKSLRKQEILNESNNQNQQLDVEKQKDKYIKMTKSPYQFFLGSSYLFYNDISKLSSPYQTACLIHGNLNINSFRVFKDEKGNAIFDVNYFHEGFKGSYFYDLLRMAVSILLYGDSLKLSKKEKKETISQFLKGYYKQLKKFQKGKADCSIVFTKKNTDGPVKKYLKKLEKNEEGILDDITSFNEENKRIFILSESLIEITGEERESILSAIEQYLSSINEEQLKIKDIVRKVEHDDIGSFGLDRFYVLVEDVDSEEFVLEVNEVCAPVPAYYLPINEWKQYEHEGERVVTIEKKVRKLDDPYLSYFTIDEKQYYVQKLRAFKKVEVSKVKKLQKAVKIMGKVTAKIHCSEDEKISTDILNEIADFDEFYKVIISLAIPYKKRVYKDYKIFSKWIDDEYFEHDEIQSDENTIVLAQDISMLYADESNNEQLTEEVETNEQTQKETEDSLNEESLAPETEEQSEELASIQVEEVEEQFNIEVISSEEETVEPNATSSSLNLEVAEAEIEPNSVTSTSDEEKAEDSNVVSTSSDIESMEVELEEPNVEEAEQTNDTSVSENESEETEVTEVVEQSITEMIPLEEKEAKEEPPKIDTATVEQNKESENLTQVVNETPKEENVHETEQQTTSDSEVETTEAEMEVEEVKQEEQANVEISATIVEKNETTKSENEEKVELNPNENHSKNTNGEKQQNKQNYQTKNRNTSPRSKGNRRTENKSRINQNSNKQPESE